MIERRLRGRVAPGGRAFASSVAASAASPKLGSAVSSQPARFVPPTSCPVPNVATSAPSAAGPPTCASHQSRPSSASTAPGALSSGVDHGLVAAAWRSRSTSQLVEPPPWEMQTSSSGCRSSTPPSTSVATARASSCANPSHRSASKRARRSSRRGASIPPGAGCRNNGTSSDAQAAYSSSNAGSSSGRPRSVPTYAPSNPRSDTDCSSSTTAAAGSCIGSWARPRSRSGCSATSSASASLCRRANSRAVVASTWCRNVSGFGDRTARSMPSSFMRASRRPTSMNGLSR